MGLPVTVDGADIAAEEEPAIGDPKLTCALTGLQLAPAKAKTAAQASATRAGFLPRIPIIKKVPVLVSRSDYNLASACTNSAWQYKDVISSYDEL